MIIIDYLLLGGFAAAGVYTIYRLFVGFRNSSTAKVLVEETEEADHTGAPWRAEIGERE
jgi:hypothetical protein